MSRHGYNEDCGGNWDLIRWRGVVASAEHHSPCAAWEVRTAFAKLYPEQQDKP